MGDAKTVRLVAVHFHTVSTGAEVKTFWVVIAVSSAPLTLWLLHIIFGKPKPVQSRHAWYTVSGALSRVASFFALRWANAPNDFFPIAVFAYGMVELFGVGRSVKIIRRMNARIKKVRTAPRTPGSSSAASGSVRGGPHV